MNWDPTPSMEAPQPLYSRRIKKESGDVCSNPPPGIFGVPDEKDFTLFHAVIMGPSDTPYEGGFFYFIMRFPPNYPFSPPKMKLMTTGGGSVRFNPNLYANGKVCLSILGTWAGPPWTAGNTITSVLISVQSLMSENPYQNEPGREKMPAPVSYLQYLKHETLRVAVVCMLDNDHRITMPPALRKTMEKEFLKGYANYERLVKANVSLTGKTLVDSAYNERTSGQFIYTTLLTRLRTIKARLDKDYPELAGAGDMPAGRKSNSDSEPPPKKQK